MHKKKSSAKSAFTLIEVMIAVVIISTVIMALIQMYANNIHIFSSLKAKTDITQYGSSLLENPEIGFEKKETNLYALLDGFDVADDLRHHIKDVKVKVVYQEFQTIDLSEFNGDEEQNNTTEDGSIPTEEQTGTNMLLEIGKTTLKFDDGATSIMRIQLK
jgi:prepilin-type N-terminal cleavage/methylation domain-containing protein